MSKRPSTSQPLVLRAAALARNYDDGPTPRDDTDTITTASDDPEESNAARVAAAQYKERWSEKPPVPDEDLAGDQDLGPGPASGQPVRARPGRRGLRAHHGDQRPGHAD